MIKLVAVDMDATFLKDDKTYDVPLFKTIHQALHQKGIKFVVASGNGVSKLKTSFDANDQENIIFAGDNGNQIEFRGKQLRLYGMSYDVFQQLETFLSNNSGYYPILNSIDTNYIFGNNPIDALDAFYRYNVSVTKLELASDLPKDIDILNVAVYSQNSLEETKQFAQRLMIQFPQLSAVTSGERWMDVFQAGGGKGTAITYLQNLYHIQLDECLAFGDSLNDLSMMNVVGYNVAMGNADRQLIKSCQYQIGTNNDQSVLHVLSELLQFGDVAIEKYRI